MVTITVNKLFYDRVCRVDRHAGDKFDVTDERAAQILSRLPSGYVTVCHPEETSPVAADETPTADDGVADLPQDLSKLRNQQLEQLIRERGLEVPKRAKKAQLIAILSEE